MPRTRAKASAGNAAPWWLMDGDEECLNCGQLYIYELKFHCPECEMTTCMHCRRRHCDGRLICVSCLDAAGASDGR